MKVSIIVPVYNVEKYIERCIESLIHSSYKNLEIILVNDGATDGSTEILKKYQFKDERIKVINRENGGLSAARNSGIENATGDYILFVDGDDWINPDCISQCLPYIKDNADVVMFSFVREYGNISKKADLFNKYVISFSGENKMELVRRLVGPTGKEIAAPHRIEDINVAHSKLYKRDLIKNKRFIDTKIIGTEDLWFNLAVFFEAKKIVYINEHLYHYNKENECSLTNIYNNQLFNRWKILYSYIAAFIGSNFICDDAERALKNRKVIELFTLTRNVVHSGIPEKEKKWELRRILSDKIYIEAFEGFDYGLMPIQWRIFYKSCEHKRIRTVRLLLTVAEKIRKRV